MAERPECSGTAVEQGIHTNTELSDLELLASALQDAMDAHRLAVIVGPPVDEVALARAARRARRRDASRALRTVAGGAA